MSAFVVSKTHIDAMVQAGLAPSRIQGDKLRWFAHELDAEHSYQDAIRELDYSNASEVGAMLWAENVTSVSYRYSPPGRVATYGHDLGKEADPITELPGTYKQVSPAPGIEPVEVGEWTEPYTFPLGRVQTLSPVETLAAIDCYEYQSCEHDGWKDSEAKRFCEALRSRMIHSLPGYDEAAWEVTA